jgi:Transcriptional regulator PadR-like family.
MRQSSIENVAMRASLYPSLQRLEDRGCVEAEWGTSEPNRHSRFYLLPWNRRKEPVQEESESRPDIH